MIATSRMARFHHGRMSILHFLVAVVCIALTVGSAHTDSDGATEIEDTDGTIDAKDTSFTKTSDSSIQIPAANDVNDKEHEENEEEEESYHMDPPVGYYDNGLEILQENVFVLEDSFVTSNYGNKEAMRSEIGCYELESPGPIHGEKEFMLLRGAYQAIVGSDASSLQDIQYGNGYEVPVYVGYHPLMGRGVFAKASIANGTKIWDERYTGCFEQGWQYRNFLLSIPVRLACDVMVWSYVLRLTNNTKVAICTDLDESSFTNQAYFESQVNVFEDQTLDPSQLFAARDIEPGEQLIVEYGDFVYSNGWKHFGL
uniref:SET domain-containing protein n=1 Tax=Craspedostauros australis TaxID=1486917 RepID=A0A7R9ZRL9_9STRA|mmetsp:Transcript_7261/g.19665  ORF Transcript_7261/g.19665 Transcript_7261/m.19665 type:complete len:313 (+) Transcript_7261:277-1215(+)